MTWYVAAVATFAAGTIAVSCVAETNVVVNAVPFQFTTELVMKLVPFTVRVNCDDPARHELGLIELIVGTGFAANELLAAVSIRTNGRSFFMDMAIRKS